MRLNHGTWEVLVLWSSSTTANATPGPLSQFQLAYSEFKLEDKLFCICGQDIPTAQQGSQRACMATGGVPLNCLSKEI